MDEGHSRKGTVAKQVYVSTGNDHIPRGTPGIQSAPAALPASTHLGKQLPRALVLGSPIHTKTKTEPSHCRYLGSELVDGKFILLSLCLSHK